MTKYKKILNQMMKEVLHINILYNLFLIINNNKNFQKTYEIIQINHFILK